MDPEESHNATSRIREAEFLTALEGVVPVPHVYFVDEEGEWFPQPALVYAFADGVAKATNTNDGSVSGLGTGFPAHLREPLAKQFVEQLGIIHGFDVDQAGFTSMEKPEIGSTEAARWQLNRARRVWEEDGSVQTPLMTVAVNWLERNLPTTDKVSIVHGDFRSGNFLFDENSAEITALLDWERGHLGDRHRDLAWTTQAMFAHPADDGSGLLVCGLMPEEQFYEAYTAASGLTVDATKMQWYAVLNAYQVLVTTLGSCYRVVRLEKNHQPALLSVLKAEAALCADRLRLLMMEVIG
jgi:aminoglycoside phosphotransferase (APT) family kinase protein